MAEEKDLIDRYVDRALIAKDTEFLLEQLAQVDAMFTKLQNAKITIGSSVSTKETVAATKEANRAYEDLVKSKTKLIDVDIKSARIATELARARSLEAKAAKDIAAAALLEAKARESNIKSIVTQEKELDRLIAKEEKANKASAVNAAKNIPVESITNLPDTENIKKTGDVVIDLEKKERDAALSAIEWANAQKQVTKPLQDNKKSAEELRRIEEQNIKIAAEEKLLAGQRAAALKNQVREENAVKGSLEQRRAALIRLNAVYDNLSPQERASAAGQRLQKITAGLTNQVKELELASGRAQRNVGNYGGALQKAFGFLRNIAYLVPGIGIAGLLGLIVAPLYEIGKAAFSSTAKLGSFRDILNRTADIMQSAKDSFASASATVAKLRTDIDLAKEGFIDKDIVVKEYNDTIGKTTGFVKSLDEAEQALAKNAEAYIRFTFLKAVATEAFARAGKEAVDTELQNQKDLQTIQDVGKKKKNDPNDGLNEFLASGLENERYVREQNGKKRVKVINDIAEKYEKLAAEISKKFKFNFDGAGDTTQIKAPKASFDDYDLKKQEEAFKKLSEVETLQQQSRINARKKAADIEQRIIEGQRRVAVQNEEQKYNEIKSKVGVTKNELINAEIEKKDAIEKINTDAANKIKEKESKLQDDLIDIKYQSIAKQRDLDKKANEETIRGLEEIDRRKLQSAQKKFERKADTTNTELNERLKVIEETEQAELRALDRRKQKGKISEQQYINERNRILKQGELDRLHATVDAQGQLIDAEIRFTEHLIDLAKQRGEDVTALELKISKLKLEYQKNANSEALAREQEYNSKLQELLNQRQAAYKELEGEILNTVTQVIGYTFDRRNIAIQKEIDQLEKKKEKEIEVANATIGNEQEKAAALTSINIRADAQREALERKQRKVEADRAKFEKISALLRVTVDTVQKVAAIRAQAALLLANPITAALAPLALAQIPIVIASGAVAAAAIAAQPVPKYKTGTTDHPGGPAIVGDGGRKEFVLLPSGEGFFTPSSSTMLNLPKHSQVIPEDKLLDNMMRASMKGIPSMPMNEGNYAKQMTEQLTKELRAVNKTIQNKPTYKVQGTYSSIMAMHEWAQNKIKHIDDEINF